MRTKLRLVVLGFLAPLVIGGALLAGASPASADIQDIAPHPKQICKGDKFEVGVRYAYEGGPRRYRVNVFNPAGDRIFHRHGKATHDWKSWRIKAKRKGRYTVRYKQIRHGEWVGHSHRVRAFKCEDDEG